MSLSTNNPQNPTKKRPCDEIQPQRYRRTRARIAELDEEVRCLRRPQEETLDAATKLDRLENENRKLYRIIEAIKTAVAEDEEDGHVDEGSENTLVAAAAAGHNPFYGEGVDVTLSLLDDGVLSSGGQDTPITVPPTMLHPIPRKIHQIYEAVFRIGETDARAVADADPGVIFKAVNEGWQALDARTMRNPLFWILFQIDQRMFYQQRRVTRLAILYKDMDLLKYYVNPSKRNLDNLPPWIQPKPSQLSTEFPLTINFFPWPHVRKILAANPIQYSSSTEFSTEFRRCFRFYWPFPFQNAFGYDQTTRTYRVNPLFDRYYRNMASWGVDRAFFQRFPEFAEGFDGDALLE